ncbi:hypothetical protein Drose_08105 [Dactylosporangium roseum]|uniref:Uncharacterized protein n=1 Tax=Dactylosporangium roseum TaxID=47989 RepID=A0ABY5Z840_9ACTN|nr:hypothetical protein [Dactylosporangium roseum]UWZ38201.1 hypothetical protein Drose_08105 [Dactylosporangium roseum]
MTGPADKLVALLETLPPESRQEITVWLLGRTGPAGHSELLAGPELRGRALIGTPELRPVQLQALGGALPVGEESQLVTFRLPTDRHAELRAWCAEHGFTMAAVVRGLIERFLEEQQRR